MSELAFDELGDIVDSGPLAVAKGADILAVHLSLLHGRSNTSELPAQKEGSVAENVVECLGCTISVIVVQLNVEGSRTGVGLTGSPTLDNGSRIGLGFVEVDVTGSLGTEAHLTGGNAGEDDDATKDGGKLHLDCLVTVSRPQSRIEDQKARRSGRAGTR